MSVSDSLSQFLCYRVDSFERVGERDDVISRLVPGLRAAHSLRAPVVWATICPGDGTGLTTWFAAVGAPSAAQAEPDRIARLCLPPGADATALTSAQVSELLDIHSEWIVLEAIPTAAAEALDNDELRSALLTQIAELQYACVVSAVPATGEDIDAELSTLDRATRSNQMEGRADFASSRWSSGLSTERYGELATARQLGGWSIRVQVGGRPGEVEVAAEMLAAALDMPGVAFQRQGSTNFNPPETWRLPKESFVGSTRQLATLVRWPAAELPGLVLRQPMPFDVNAEEERGGRGRRRIELGATLDRALRPGGRFGVSESTLNRHTLVCGATGSGKSQTVQHLLEQLSTTGIPWLVIEPAKSEYREMRARLQAAGLDPSVQVIRLGDATQAPLGLNPLEPEPGFPLQTHLDMVAALFVASFDAAEPFPQILAESLRRCYTDLGWRLATGDYKANEFGRPTRRGTKSPRYPHLSDLRRTARDVVYDAGYGKEIRDNVLGFVDVRLGSLKNGTPGRFFEGGHPLDIAALLRQNVVIEIEDVGNDLDKAFVIGTVVLRLYEHLRVKGQSGGELLHVTVVEEAHRLLRHSEGEKKPNQAVELFGSMLSEVRAFGEGIVIAEQIPTKILPDVLKNTAVQIVHRLPSVEDRAVLAGTTNMNEEQSAYVLSLGPGHAAAFREGMDAPVLLRVDHPGPIPPYEGPVPEGRGLRSRPRSVACTAECCDRPCDARLLDQTDVVSAAVPELPFWIELALLAAVTGLSVPKPLETWRARAQERLSDPQTLGCVLASLVDEAVTARWAQLADFFSPDDLTLVLLDVVRRGVLAEPISTNAFDSFVAGRRFLAPVFAALRASEHTETGPHPLTENWRTELGVELPSLPVSNQLAWLELSRLFSYRGDERIRSGVVPGQGNAPTSRLGELALQLSDQTGFEAIWAAARRVARVDDSWRENLQKWFPTPAVQPG